MSSNSTSLMRRRQFLRGATLIAAGLGAGGWRIFGAIKKSYKLNVALIGCGGAGAPFPGLLALRENLVALVDVDERKLADAMRSASAAGAAPRPYHDYRQMLEANHSALDAVIICAPDHHHAPAALRAMALGKHVLVQEPLARTPHEARALRLAARDRMVVTQTANPALTSESVRLLCEHVWAGTIGPVREVHGLLERNYGATGPCPPVRPVPAWLHWDQWLGPAPAREYHPELHPAAWRAWTDFGTGSLGDMGCHVLAGAYWALKLWQAPFFSVECRQQTAGGAGRYPRHNTIRWDFPARGDMPPVQIYAHDADWPPLVKDLEWRFEEKFRGGAIYMGEKMMMFTGPMGEGPRLIPPAEHDAQPKPPKKLERPNQGVLTEFLEACRGKTPASANFEMAGPLSEIVLAGVLASRVGLGRRLEWDVERLACINHPEVNDWSKPAYRPGWEI